MLTKKQAQLVEAIKNYTKANGFPPTMRELADNRGVSLFAIQGMLERLKKAGIVTWIPAAPRTLRVTEKDNESN